MVEMEWSTAEELKQIEKEIKVEIDEASHFAKTADIPPIESLYADVYSDEVPARGTLLGNGNQLGWLKKYGNGQQLL